MKTPKPFILLFLLAMQLTLSAQVQWYQNQDGNNPFPNGTSATSVQSFTPSSFVACYLWTVNNDTYTWKISKSDINGTEQKTFFVSGNTASAEVKLGSNNTVYVLKRNFPMGGNAEYTVYKLDSNLVVKAQQSIGFPNSFNIFNLNAFEVDKWNNVYLAGDGQYPNGPGFGPASFVLKADKDLVTKWSRMDSVQTSFTNLRIDRWGTVLVVADFYTFYPDVHLKRISADGRYAQNFTIQTDPGRFSLFTTLDDDDDLLLYGGKSIGDTAQAMFLYKFSRFFGRIVYRKTLFKAAGTQINDLKMDGNGNIFTLVTEYRASGQYSKISRINSNSGNILWSHSSSYTHDSCNLVKLVVTRNERFYALGQRTTNNYFSKGFAIRMKKNGQADGNFPAPDSVGFERSHWLCDGITDRNNQLIAIGGTTDLDTTTFYSSYLRAFALRFSNNGCNTAGRPGAEEETTAASTSEEGTAKEEIQVNNKLVIYPNPVQNQLTVTNVDPNTYDKIILYNMQGAQLQQQTVKGTTARIDVSTLPEGMYLMVLRSSVTLKEKSIKFLVSK